MGTNRTRSSAGTKWTPEAIAKLDEIVGDSHGVSIAEKGLFARAFKVSSAIQRLREAITPDVMNYIMSLQGSSLGFRTDKDGKGGYPVETVRDCFIEATLRGAYPVDNEWNIIADRCYLALNFFKRKLRPENLPGLSDLRLSAEVPDMKDGGARVAYRSSWVYNGVSCEFNRILYKTPKTPEHPDGLTIDERIPIRVNSGMIVDAVLGKAERKMRAMILARITNMDQDDAEPEITSVISAPPTGRGSLRETPKNGSPAPAPAQQSRTIPETGETIDTRTGEVLTAPAAEQRTTEPPKRDPQLIYAEFEERIQSCRGVVQIDRVIEDLKNAAASMDSVSYEKLMELAYAKREELAKPAAGKKGRTF